MGVEVDLGLWDGSGANGVAPRMRWRSFVTRLCRRVRCFVFPLDDSGCAEPRDGGELGGWSVIGVLGMWELCKEEAPAKR